MTVGQLGDGYGRCDVIANRNENAQRDRSLGLADRYRPAERREQLARERDTDFGARALARVDASGAWLALHFDEQAVQRRLSLDADRRGRNAPRGLVGIRARDQLCEHSDGSIDENRIDSDLARANVLGQLDERVAAAEALENARDDVCDRRVDRRNVDGSHEIHRTTDESMKTGEGGAQLGERLARARVESSVLEKPGPVVHTVDQVARGMARLADEAAVFRLRRGSGFGQPSFVRSRHDGTAARRMPSTA